MRQLTTDDLRTMLDEKSRYYSKLVAEMSDDEVIECFGQILRAAYAHSHVQHYTSILDEPRY